ncbi:Larp4b [Symbiodinium natans]|uniref:Larp4b protein n=1 Tax=Symbiodinium natans TaxID=878477 RepID=A0A812PS59_9DINO|nr:Larp4b [Symbiodinium natans]
MVLQVLTARNVLFLGAFPWPSFGKGNEDCFRGGNGLTYEACCQEARGCWGDAEWAREYCCEGASSADALERWNLLAATLSHVRDTVDCELKAWLHGVLPMCEKGLIARLSALDIIDASWVSSSWVPSMLYRRGRTAVEGLHFVMLLCQTVLHWRTAAQVGAGLGDDLLAPFRASHAKAAEELRRYSLEATTRSWTRQLKLLKLLGTRPRDAGAGRAADAGAGSAVHVALVASVGEPVFAFKAMATIRSALFFARRKKLHFHLFVDAAGELALRGCLDELRQKEPILAARAANFELHGEDVLQRFFRVLRANLGDLPGCLGQTKLFGDTGWIRLFVHELFRHRPDVALLVFVDAGDYVFLEDVSLVLRHRGQFGESQLAASPRDGDMPFQLLDLPRMRRLNFTKILSETVREGFGESPSYWCSLGEGVTTRALAQNASLWHVFEEPWIVEPREHGGVQGRGGGVKNVWKKPAPRPDDAAIWRDRVYPGLFDWTVLHVHCPLFVETFLATTLEGSLPPSRSQYKFLGWVVRPFHSASIVNATLEASGVHNGHLSFLRCNEKALGVHFTSTLKSVPWGRNFLNFWAGAGNLGRDGRRAWGDDAGDWQQRSLTSAAAFS